MKLAKLNGKGGMALKAQKKMEKIGRPMSRCSEGECLGGGFPGTWGARMWLNFEHRGAGKGF